MKRWERWQQSERRKPSRLVIRCQATAAVTSNVDDVDLVASIKIVGSRALANTRRIWPLGACVDSRGEADHRVWLGDPFSRCQFLDVECVAPRLLALDSRIGVAAANVECVSVVHRFLAAAS